MVTFFQTLLVLIALSIVLSIYFWPLDIALRKKVEDKLAVFIINLLLAWTGIGLIICLMWAISLPDNRTEVEKGETKGLFNKLALFVKTQWKYILIVLIVISALAGIGEHILGENNSNSTQQSDNIQTNEGYIDSEPVYTQNCMPRTLKERGVSVECFEKANSGDNSKCSVKQLEKIKTYFKQDHPMDVENYCAY